MEVLVAAQGEILENIESQVCSLSLAHPWFFVCIYACVCRMQGTFSLICVNERLVQVNNAVDHVQRGTSALQNAKKLQKNSRKWMCIAIIILLIIVAIIVVGVLKPWKSS